MASKKSGSPQKTRVAPGAAGLAQWLAGPGRAPIGMAVVLVAFAAAWFGVWQSVQEEVQASTPYWVSQQDVDITPLAGWIRTDVRAEVFRDASLNEPLSLLDPELVPRLAKAFALHPWVREVRRVEKRHPSKVYVELAYRQPVAMVSVPGGYYPVDADGALLPTADFAATGPGNYARVTGIDTIPVGPVGNRWGDLRVQGAAQIAAAFGPRWQELKLDRVAPSKPTDSSVSDYTYDLLTRDGTRIHWGRAPNTPASGEIPAADKIARIVEYGRRHGALDAEDGPQELDVRTLRP